MAKTPCSMHDHTCIFLKLGNPSRKAHLLADCSDLRVPVSFLRPPSTTPKGRRPSGSQQGLDRQYESGSVKDCRAMGARKDRFPMGAERQVRSTSLRNPFRSRASPLPFFPWAGKRSNGHPSDGVGACRKRVDRIPPLRTDVIS